MVSLPLAGERRTKGSRVIVIRIDESEVRLEWGMEEEGGLGRLGESILRGGGRFYREATD
jgi:hypothetical protein